MAGLEPALRARLKQLKVRIDNPDADTLLLRNVPADSRYFSQAADERTREAPACRPAVSDVRG